MINAAWKEGRVPEQWKLARTILIPKPGKPPTSDNMRPISLTSCISKVAEHAILHRQERQARSPRKMHSCGFPQEGPDAGPGSAAPLFTAASLAQSRCSAVPASGPQPDRLSLQSQSFSQGYGSVLPTSLTYIALSTRGCSPWRPAADVGVVRHENHTPSLGFSRAHRSTPDSARAALLYGTTVPI
ncbi:hypothetical protein HPB51_017758 [Rhipicephalus microplus]|uniref:Tick transposon n=1 Tax=Rhipicephalus microplus TaxID=6941 RepID=A0A9J6ENY9_RHIMP|nr:hypothetical protein HPB51_017758 [Rhipicephalus microplus]